MFICLAAATLIHSTADAADLSPGTNIHWAFLPPHRPALPTMQKATKRAPSEPGGLFSRSRPRGGKAPVEVHPIDAFILDRLAREGIEPAPEADRATLIRRLSLDLTGLPPTPAEVDRFVHDLSPQAYEKVVEALLASPHYGERWGRHWLDAARYADSNGYSIDAPRAVWKYRDWVIAALNRDMPFDQFTLWQLAGDFVDTNTLPRGTSALEPLIATGFHRNTQINQEGGIDPEQFRVESVMDRVNTTATTWLGVTLGCAQCHDHKSDPFTQREYYRFYALFNSTVEDGHGKGSPEGVLEIPGEQEDATKEKIEAESELVRMLDTKGGDVSKWEQGLTDEQRSKLRPEVTAALAVPMRARTLQQKRVIYSSFRPDDPDFRARDRKLARLEKSASKPVTTLVMRELEKPRETHVFIKGDFTRPAEVVTPGIPAALEAFTATGQRRPDSSPSFVLANRNDLARWLVDTNNPLTARVTVNRIWQQYFGRGLVETENDFGRLGARPSHPELLDWLACELMDPHIMDAPLADSPAMPADSHLGITNENGTDAGASEPRPGRPSSKASAPVRWSLKHLHRLIVTSATYRQSSKARPELAAVDPNNRLLARQGRQRLEAEVIRDVSLAASGLLNPRMGGPSVYPPQPDGVMNLGQSNREWKPSAGADRYRRGLYTFFWRATPYPALMVFDAADGFSSCTRRVRSNTPLQALTLLNDEAFDECARALAARVQRDGPPADEARLDYAFRLCLARSPQRTERQRLREVLAQERDRSGPELAWFTVSRVLLNLDETVTRE
jgi:hypothetical protein